MDSGFNQNEVSKKTKITKSYITESCFEDSDADTPACLANIVLSPECRARFGFFSDGFLPFFNIETRLLLADYSMQLCFPYCHFSQLALHFGEAPDMLGNGGNRVST